MSNRLIAIGDIHGEIEKLNSLLDKLDLQKQDRVIFLGDYIDRGKNLFLLHVLKGCMKHYQQL